MVEFPGFRFVIGLLKGPRLYRIHKAGDREGRLYEPNSVEGYSDNLIRSLAVAWSIGMYASPIIITTLYRRGYVTYEGLITQARLAGVVCTVLVGTFIIRGVGRMVNGDYIPFLRALHNAQENLNKSTKAELMKYDSEFYAWPVDFRWNDPNADPSKQRVSVDTRTSKRRTFLSRVLALPCDVLSYVAIHTFGRRLMYPGAVGLLQAAVGPMLIQGRAKLVEEYGGVRNKLLTRDGNEIDSVFVDRRNSNLPNGNILVVCCEGNAGFYEYGTTSTPIEAGYSVLGWNHPGFAGSTGVPYPDQEQNAIDCVMQFAIHRLGFLPENIVVFAWSIGAYTGTWAAMNYPDIKGLVLDATFDDVVPLATSKMPPSWEPLVKNTIRGYMNLNNLEHLQKYKGPVLMYRRTRDEIITTVDATKIQSNRGNDLLVGVLQQRYPNLVTNDTQWALREWLSGDQSHQMVLWEQQGVDEDTCLTMLRSYIEDKGFSIPLCIGDSMQTEMKVQLLLFLARKHMIDFNSTHCTPLPPSLFQLPWNASTLTEGNNGGGELAALSEMMETELIIGGLLGSMTSPSFCDELIVTNRAGIFL
ncbi:phosphatidylserine lipase ABHD16A-like isoform X2 [Ornithodoros turicata]|uniref:phosphatidylserine lipase ABHD16A-like isoform X2 n=1 Tax=Ornithodoros turicata TaxID=34597 RepID=UPI003138D28F